MKPGLQKEIPSNCLFLKSDALGQAVVDLTQIRQDRIEAHIRALETPRFTSAEKQRAIAYITDQLTSYGYEIARQGVGGSENLVAHLPGGERSNEVYVIGAHFDSVRDTPGADDNASGVAGMLEIARVFQQLLPG